ncbi:MAG: DUF1727 domain-containing protein [Clostridia bacterium]|nr:DUF1727 domain-containing protein [Clostridia bacterium]
MKLLAIILGKIIVLLGKLLGKGSSMPGEVALKIDKNLLKKFNLPKTIIAVTGSSGKGSTSSIIAHVYRKMGYKVVHNASGANLTAGITTMLLENCSLFGKVHGDVLVYEMDERYAKFVFEDVKPSHIIITNITRDQPPRQGHFDCVYEEVKKALPKGVTLVLNGDDPYLLKFNLNNEYNTIYYTLDKTKWSYHENKFKNLNLVYCPKCNHKFNYEYYHFENIGKFNCPKCDFTHPDSNYHITNLDYNNFEMTVNNAYKLNLQYDLLYSVYNTMAAFTACSELGLDKEVMSQHINELNQNNKMYNHYTYNNKDVYVLNNKNENSTTFNQSLLFTERFEGTKTIVIGWKEISRRYDFDDLSWLYDIDFEILNNLDVDKVICTGPNAYDIATRIKLAGLNNIEVYDNLTEAKGSIVNANSKYIFGILNFDYVAPFKAIFETKEETK